MLPHGKLVTLVLVLLSFKLILSNFKYMLCFMLAVRSLYLAYWARKYVSIWLCFSQLLTRLFGYTRFSSGSICWEHLKSEASVRLTSPNTTVSLCLHSVGELSLKTRTLTQRMYRSIEERIIKAKQQSVKLYGFWWKHILFEKVTSTIKHHSTLRHSAFVGSEFTSTQWQSLLGEGHRIAVMQSVGKGADCFKSLSLSSQPKISSQIHHVVHTCWLTHAFRQMCRHRRSHVYTNTSSPGQCPRWNIAMYNDVFEGRYTPSCTTCP